MSLKGFGSMVGFFTQLHHNQNYPLSLFSRAIWTSDNSFPASEISRQQALSDISALPYPKTKEKHN